MTAKEQGDFQIKSLDLPIPINATIFGVKVLLHVPSQVFPFLCSNIELNSNPISIAAFSELLPNILVPTTFKNILNQSIAFLNKQHECFQYTADSIIFLSNAFPDLDTEFILDVLESFNLNLFKACIFLNNEYIHAHCNQNSEIIEIFNPYAAHQISNLLAFDNHYQKIHKPKNCNIQNKINEYNTNNNTHNINIEYKISQEKKDELFAINLMHQFEEEDRQLSEMHMHYLQQIQIDDENYARELQAHFEEEIKEKKKREEEENLAECCCCYASVPFIEMAQCPEGHLICRRCIEMSIETALSEGRVRTGCLSTDGCNTKISNSELERILPEKLLKRLNEAEALNAIISTNIPGLRTCWKCGFKAIDENENTPFNCPQCNEKTCKACNKKHHQGRKCDEVDLDPNRIVEKKMSEAIVKQCPKCQTQFIKDEGCNHMTCPRCKTEFCYLCGKVITGNVSEHYTVCAQFIDNKKYNNEQIKIARENALKDLGMD